MSTRRRLTLVVISLVCVIALAFTIHELKHFYRYGHLAPMGLHVDLAVSSEANLLGIRGVANVYHARLTNYNVLPITMTVCDYINWASAHDTMMTNAASHISLINGF
jgi:hypothetical protein